MQGTVLTTADAQCGSMVDILLCTFNGAAFLPAQLDSIEKQTHRHWSLFVSDDGSTDGTLSLIENFAQRVGSERVYVFTGPKCGFAKNFMSLIERPQIDAPYIAFADQDDVWLPEKLERAIHVLEQQGEGPALYAGRTRYIDAHDRVLGESTLFVKQPSFANALVQSVGGGNTMMINRHVINRMRSAAQRLDIYSHDWWLYLFVSALGGFVFYDSKPLVLYRQHSSNVVGMNTTWSQKWRRIQMLWAGDFAHWNECNIAALAYFRPQMSPGIGKIFDCFVRARKQSFFMRIANMYAAGVYRQTTLGNVGLWFAILTNKI
jgi:glycosyltransferase involved in cell wall biosynthesis